MTVARAFWTLGPDEGEIREESLPAPSPGFLRMKALYSGISRGTETLVFSGRVPESEYQSMRCPLQEGHFPGPVKYGYASVGSVDQGPDAWLGRTVFSLHPHQDTYDIPLSMAVVVPDDIPPRRAILAANMETALNVLWDAGAGPGQRIAVIGLGVVGLLCGYLSARMPGVELVGVDIDADREDAAEHLGIPFSTKAPDGFAADIVIHTSGSASGLETSLTLAGQEATIIEASWHGSGTTAVPLGGAFHSRRLILRSSQVGQVSPGQRPRWPHHRRLSKAMELLSDPQLDALIDGESAFTSLPTTMAALADGRQRALCHCIRYQ